MEAKEVFDELKTILVTRLKFDPRQAVDLTLETTMPKGVDGSLGLGLLDLSVIAIAIHPRAYRRRVKSVAVTGLGVVSPFGAGVKAFWEGIASGSCAIRPITLIETEGFRWRIAAEGHAGLAGSGR